MLHRDTAEGGQVTFKEQDLLKEITGRPFFRCGTRTLPPLSWVDAPGPPQVPPTTGFFLQKCRNIFVILFFLFSGILRGGGGGGVFPRPWLGMCRPDPHTRPLRACKEA